MDSFAFVIRLAELRDLGALPLRYSIGSNGLRKTGTGKKAHWNVWMISLQFFVVLYYMDGKKSSIFDDFLGGRFILGGPFGCCGWLQQTAFGKRFPLNGGLVLHSSSDHDIIAQRWY